MKYSTGRSVTTYLSLQVPDNTAPAIRRSHAGPGAGQRTPGCGRPGNGDHSHACPPTETGPGNTAATNSGPWSIPWAHPAPVPAVHRQMRQSPPAFPVDGHSDGSPGVPVSTAWKASSGELRLPDVTSTGDNSKEPGLKHITSGSPGVPAAPSAGPVYPMSRSALSTHSRTLPSLSSRARVRCGTARRSPSWPNDRAAVRRTSAFPSARASMRGGHRRRVVRLAQRHGGGAPHHLLRVAEDSHEVRDRFRTSQYAQHPGLPPAVSRQRNSPVLQSAPGWPPCPPTGGAPVRPIP